MISVGCELASGCLAVLRFCCSRLVARCPDRTDSDPTRGPEVEEQLVGTFTVDAYAGMTEEQLKARCRQLSRRLYRVEYALLDLSCEFTAVAPPGDNRPAIARARELIRDLQNAYEE